MREIFVISAGQRLFKSTKQTRNNKVQHSIYSFERFYFILVYLKSPKYPR